MAEPQPRQLATRTEWASTPVPVNGPIPPPVGPGWELDQVVPVSAHLVALWRRDAELDPLEGMDAPILRLGTVQAVTVLACEELTVRLERQVEQYLDQPEVRVGLDRALRVIQTLGAQVDAGQLPPPWAVLVAVEEEPEETPDTERAT